jgi:acyl-CoA thioester hydrolase
MTEMPFRYSLRVRYSECDAQHVVYNAKYGEYFDLAATEFLRTAFAPQSIFDGTFEFQVVKLLVEWTGPARFDDTLDVFVRPTRFGTTSFTLGFEIVRRGEPKPIVTGETVNVLVDPKTWTKKPLDETMKRQLSSKATGRAVDQAG